MESVKYAANRIDDKIKFTDEACAKMVKVPRIFLPTALKGCVRVGARKQRHADHRRAHGHHQRQACKGEAEMKVVLAGAFGKLGTDILRQLAGAGPRRCVAADLAVREV